MFKTNNVKLQIPEMMICEYKCKILGVDNATLEILFSHVENHPKPFIMIVIPTRVISPMLYPIETWEFLQNTIDMLNIDTTNVDFYLDYSKFIHSDKSFSSWDFVISKHGEYVSDQLIELSENEIPSAVKLVRDNYYNR